ncbi:MAG: zinc ribbon domain-containing protein [Phycisphaerales bacterium]
MPTYDYKCKACGHEFEEFQSMTAPVLKKCPKCGKNQLERLIGTGAALMFKGSGFYITDYRSDSYKKAAKADSGKPAEAAKSDAKSADAKPAAPAKEAAPKSSSADSKPKSKKSSKPD